MKHWMTARELLSSVIVENGWGGCWALDPKLQLTLIYPPDDLTEEGLLCGTQNRRDGKPMWAVGKTSNLYALSKSSFYISDKSVFLPVSWRPDGRDRPRL